MLFHACVGIFRWVLCGIGYSPFGGGRTPGGWITLRFLIPNLHPICTCSCLFTPLTEGRSARDLTQAATSQKKNPGGWIRDSGCACSLTGTYGQISDAPYHFGPDKLCSWSPENGEVAQSPFQVVLVRNFDNNMDQHLGRDGHSYVIGSGWILHLGCTNFGHSAETTLLLDILWHRMRPRFVSSLGCLSGWYAAFHQVLDLYCLGSTSWHNAF